MCIVIIYLGISMYVGIVKKMFLTNCEILKMNLTQITF